MAPYNQHNNYYDPVGSQSNQQPSGYSYRTSSATSYPSAATSNDYRSSNYPSYQNGPTYGGQYGNGTQDTSSDSRAAATLSSLSTQNYGHAGATTGADSTSQYGQSGWGSLNYESANAYTSNAPVSNRSTSTASPLYQTNGTSTSQHRSTHSNTLAPVYPSQGAQSYSASGASSSSKAYANSYTQPAQRQPPRYSSPHQAAQSAHPPRPSPQMAQRLAQSASRQQSNSVEPSAPATVDPSQVYDYRAEQQRKAQVEAERRRKIEEAEKARKPEEDRNTAERIAKEDEARKAEEFKRAVAAKKEENARKAEMRKKAREEKAASKKAATALQRMASTDSAEASTAPVAPAETDEEAEMRAMFAKMREFNKKNPSMLAKLWEEERRTAQSQPSQAAKATATQQPRTTSQPQTESSSAVPPPEYHGLPPPTTGYRPFDKARPSPKSLGKSKETTTAPAVQTPSGVQSLDNRGHTSAAPVNGTKPPPQKDSIWPAGKKAVLGEAAAKWLAAQPGNAGKNITKEAIIPKLDANPPYIELCASLEASGWVLDRAAFARTLLSAVPDGMNGRQQQPAQRPSQPPPRALHTGIGNKQSPAVFSTPHNHPPKDAQRTITEQRLSGPGQPRSNTGGRTVDYQTPAHFNLTDVAKELARRESVTSQHHKPHQSPYFAQPSTSQGLHSGTKVSRTTSQSGPLAQQQPAPPPRPPANKEEAARKRTFNDLVDLTKDDSDDEEMPPRKLPNTAGQALSTPISGAYNGQNAKEMFHRYVFQQPAPGTTDRVGKPGVELDGLTFPDGRRRLVGIPPPPTSTAEPPRAVKDAPKDPSEEIKQLERIRINNKRLVQPMQKKKVARKNSYDARTIARDVLLATGRHPSMSGLNAHLNPMQGLLADNSRAYDMAGNHADLTTIRWDVLDPGKPVIPESLAAVQDDTEDADDEDDTPALAQASEHQAVIDNGDGTITASYVPMSHMGKGLIVRKKGRGRAPRQSAPGGMQSLAGSGNNSDGPVSVHGATNKRGPGRPRASEAPTQTPRQTSTIPTNTQSAGAKSSAPADTSTNTPIGYAAFGPQVTYDENGNPIKKKGRPVGWRKSIHSREAHSLTPVKAGVYLPSRMRKEAGPSGMPAPEPQYQIYKCLWQDCGSELHNLDTLKKHVVKIHGKPNADGSYQCLWQGCDSHADEGATESKGKGKKPAKIELRTFSKIEAWLEHMEKMHIQPVGFKLGDGPPGGLSDHPDTDLSDAAYLSDRHGRSVTPIIRPTPPREATSRVAPSGVKRIGRPPKDGMSRDERDAEEELKKLEDRQRAVGIVMGRTGSRLANEKRRAGFLDDEDYEDEISEEDVPE